MNISVRRVTEGSPELATYLRGGLPDLGVAEENPTLTQQLELGGQVLGIVRASTNTSRFRFDNLYHEVQSAPTPQLHDVHLTYPVTARLEVVTSHIHTVKERDGQPVMKSARFPHHVFDVAGATLTEFGAHVTVRNMSHGMPEYGAHVSMSDHGHDRDTLPGLDGVRDSRTEADFVTAHRVNFVRQALTLYDGEPIPGRPF